MSKANNIFKSSSVRWIALAFLVLPMFASYFFDDMFSTLSHLFSNPENLELAWSAADYGYYAGAYSVLCVFGGLVFCGILLDIYGLRKVGSIFMGLMFLGAALVTYALLSKMDKQHSLILAFVGHMLFGLGSEIAGVAVTRSIAKWFKGKNVAFAMGLQLSIARLGSAAAFVIAPLLVIHKSPYYSLFDTAKPAIVGLVLIFIGIILWGFFVVLDFGRDRYLREREDVKKSKLEDQFKFSDLLKLVTNPRFIMIALLCVSFYSCIISFKKFGTAILIPRFDLSIDSTMWMLTILPFFTVIFTPLFGALVDRFGKATWWMLGGSITLLFSHIIITFAPQGIELYGFVALALLGMGYSLVPSAMWPTVPKIVPEKNWGTAYSLLYWIQNMGMLVVPIVVGKIQKQTIISKDIPSMLEAEKLLAAVRSEYIFLILGFIAIIIALALIRTSFRNPHLKIDAKANRGI